MRSAFRFVFGCAAAAVVFAALAWGFLLVGAPEQRRIERIDERRLQDLQAIVREIDRIVRDQRDREKIALKQPLPKTLADVARMVRVEQLNLRDPETDRLYGYTVQDETHYELCATFAMARDKDSGVFWNHPAGRHCFTIDVLDPNR